MFTALRVGIAGDRIDSLNGISNATFNYILTKIERTAARREDMLRKAQSLGHAEADPIAYIDDDEVRSSLAVFAAPA